MSGTSGIGKFVYISKDGILRVTKNKETMNKYSKNGKFVEASIPYMHGGYPAVKVSDDRQGGLNGVIVYSPTEMKVSAPGRNIKPIPELAELYKKCM